MAENFLKRVEAKHGTYFVPPQDIYVGRSLEVYGQWCEDEVDLFRRILKPGMIVAELGANIGSHTLAMARMVGPSGTVFAVEVQPFFTQVLSANVLLNDILNVRVVQAGIAETADFLNVPIFNYDARINFGGISLDALRKKQNPATPMQRVPIMPLDDLITVPRLDLLKMDIEGREAAAMRGAKGLIERHQPAIYLENEKPEDTAEILEVLEGYNYKAFWHRSPLFAPNNHKGFDEDIFNNVECINMLAVPERRSVKGMIPIPNAQSHPRFKR